MLLDSFYIYIQSVFIAIAYFLYLNSISIHPQKYLSMDSIIEQ